MNGKRELFSATVALSVGMQNMSNRHRQLSIDSIKTDAPGGISSFVIMMRNDTLMIPFMDLDEETPSRDRGFTYDAALLLEQRDHVQHEEWNRKYKHIRHKVYHFLDHPSTSMTVGCAIYHFVVFFIVLMAVILGASTETIEYTWMIVFYSILEVILALFFLLEFIVRIWSISADAKYRGFKGRMRYLRQLVCITDMIIIVVTFVVLIADKRYISDATMDYLRFIQILRLFHIDRQMSTWRLIKNMVMISKWELYSAYYITFFLFLLMSNLVFYTEHLHHDHSDVMNRTLIEEEESSIPTLAHAMWFSVVTITTIGYGDIVPVAWTSKVIVCILGFLAYCTFVTASTQISVGLTLMMEEDTKVEYRNKMRNNAATVIQCWFRYHLATKLIMDNKKRTQQFKYVCYKLYLTEERLTKMKAYEKRLKERKEKKRRQHHLTHQKSIQQSPSSIHSEKWKNSLRLNVTTQVIKPTGIDAAAIRKSSVARLQRYSSLPCQELGDAHLHTRAIPPILTQDEMDKLYTRRPSTDTSISSSFEGSDSEQFTLHDDQAPSVDINAVDEKILIKYQPLLRFLYFLLFCLYVKKSKRLRKADKLMEMEAEILEQMHERDQKLSELEKNIFSVVGKAVISPFDNSGEKLDVIKRVELCEQKMGEMERKIETITDITAHLLELMRNPSPAPTRAPLRSPSTLTRLPPPPPGKSLGRRLKRQQTIDSMREMSIDEDGEI